MTTTPARTATMSTPSRPTSYTTLAGITLTTLVTAGTIYSIIYDTALNTSDPRTHLTRRQDQTSYFAQKYNVLNVYFVKKAWAWTSVAFFSVFLTSPPSILRPTRRIARWVATTLVWAAFVAWFFGPSLFDRLNTLSGAQCLVRLPEGSVGHANINPIHPIDEEGLWILVSPEYCYGRTFLTPSSHPAFFNENPDIVKALAGTAALAGNSVLESLKLRPKLFRGHDVSGHLFLLSMSILFLVDQLTPSLKFLSRAQSKNTGSNTSTQDDTPAPSLALHKYTVGFAVSLIALWTFMSLTTSVYFHTPWEKLTGFGKLAVQLLQL